MKTVDNFEYIYKTFSDISNPDEFYFVQILVRGKDGHKEKGINGNNKNRLIKYYTFKSKQAILDKKDEIISICDACNARAYIHPTKRSFKGVAKEMFKVFTEDYTSENFEGLKGAYSTACGRSFLRGDKKFIVDLDGDDVNMVSEILEYIDTVCEPIDDTDSKLISGINTVHGYHLITKPFNTKKFSDKFPEIAVQTNNPTLLYYKAINE